LYYKTVQFSVKNGSIIEKTLLQQMRQKNIIITIGILKVNIINLNRIANCIISTCSI